MSYELLNSIAEDFSKELGVKCKVYSESGMYSIGAVGESGTYIKLTSVYSKRELEKAALDMLDGIRMGKIAYKSKQPV